MASFNNYEDYENIEDEDEQEAVIRGFIRFLKSTSLFCKNNYLFRTHFIESIKMNIDSNHKYDE